MPAPGVGKKKKTRKQKTAIVEQQRMVQRLFNESIIYGFHRRTVEKKTTTGL
jgi:hypothetical protein